MQCERILRKNPEKADRVLAFFLAGMYVRTRIRNDGVSAHLIFAIGRGTFAGITNRAAAASRNASRRAAIGPGRARQRQDSRYHAPHCVPDRRRCAAVANPGAHVHQQSSRRNATPRRRAGAGRSSVVRHVSPFWRDAAAAVRQLCRPGTELHDLRHERFAANHQARDRGPRNQYAELFARAAGRCD